MLMMDTTSHLSYSGDSGNDFLSEYRAISSKLKKRFLRRPNVSEANEQFVRLAKKLHEEDEPQHEGLCHLAVARCEQSVGNYHAEGEALIAASRSFLQAEKKIQDLDCPSNEEHLTAAIHSYAHAARILEEGRQASRAAGLYLELGDDLFELGRLGEAHTFYQRAADLRSSTLLEFVHARQKACACLVEVGDYHGALAGLTEVASRAETPAVSSAAYDAVRAKTEVQRVLLLLMIEPTAQNLDPELGAVLEKYAWDLDDLSSSSKDDVVVTFLAEELFLLLQSLVMAVQTKNNAAVIELEDYFLPHLGSDTKSLLRKLVANIETKVRDG